MTYPALSPLGYFEVQRGFEADGSARSIYHVEFTQRSAAFSHGGGGWTMTTPISVKDIETDVQRNDTVLQWLREHHPRFDNLRFSIRVDLIYPSGEMGDMGPISKFFADAVEEAASETHLSHRFFLRAFDPIKNQAVLRLKGGEFNFDD